MVSKHNIINGLTRFIETDMANANGATASKLIVLLAKNIIRKNENIIDSFLTHPMINTLLMESDGKYDLSALMDALKDTANEMEFISLTIPKVPFLLPNGDEIKLDVNDINKINEYINDDARLHDNHITESNGIPSKIDSNKVDTNAR